MNWAEDFEAMPVGAVVATLNGSRWRKRNDGLWDVLSDPGYGPHASRDLPSYAASRDLPGYARIEKEPIEGSCDG